MRTAKHPLPLLRRAGAVCCQSSVAPLSDVLRPLEKRVLIRSTTGRKSAQCCGANTLPIIYLEVRRTGARQLEFTCYKTRALRRNGKAQSAWRGGYPARQAQVAQLVEQRTENPRVGGSIPPLGTNKINSLAPICACCKPVPLISKGFLSHSATPCDEDAIWEGGDVISRRCRLTQPAYTSTT